MQPEHPSRQFHFQCPFGEISKLNEVSSLRCEHTVTDQEQNKTPVDSSAYFCLFLVVLVWCLQK